MAGIPLYFSAGSGASASFARLSTFVKMGTLPGSDTTIFDANGASIGYVRLKWSPTNKFVAELSFRGAVVNLNLCPSFTVLTNTWYWVSVAEGSVAGVGGVIRLYGQVTGPGGASPGLLFGEVGATNTRDLVSCAIGWGVSLSSGYSAFPNSAGQELAEFVIETNTGTQNVTDVDGSQGHARAAPSGTISPGGQIVALYTPSDTVGSAVTIHDATSDHYDMVPGGQGNAIVPDGPF